MTGLRRLVRDPLLHFLIAGGLLFAVFRALHGPDTSADARTIVVDPQTLLKFMQYRSAAFRPAYFERQFASMSPQEKRDLIGEYVREEALIREASTMGLADGDYVMRRRMAQKMLYLLDDAATESFAPSEAELQQYYIAHQDRYRVAPTVTFTHVFVDGEIKRDRSAMEAAARLKRELESRNAGFDAAPRYGDRFAYGQNYVQRARDFIENQFGPSFASALAGLEPSNHWQGPIESMFGYHLVLLTRRDPAYVPPLSQIRGEVREDLLRDTVAAYRETAITDLTKRFTVELKEISLEPPQAPAPESRRIAGTAGP